MSWGEISVLLMYRFRKVFQFNISTYKTFLNAPRMLNDYENRQKQTKQHRRYNSHKQLEKKLDKNLTVRLQPTVP